MKKLLLLMLILGLATSTQAGLIFTMNGEPQPEEVWIQEVPSGTIEIDLEWDTGTVSDYTLDYALDSDAASFITDGAVFSPGWFVGNGFVGTPTAQKFQVSGSNFGIPYTGADYGFYGILIHCDGPGDVILTIDNPGGTVVDGQQLPIEELHRLIIHQVPEPITLTLLGLGGLFLVRRKK